MRRLDVERVMGIDESAGSRFGACWRASAGEPGMVRIQPTFIVGSPAQHNAKRMERVMGIDKFDGIKLGRP